MAHFRRFRRFRFSVFCFSIASFLVFHCSLFVFVLSFIAPLARFFFPLFRFSFLTVRCSFWICLLSPPPATFFIRFPLSSFVRSFVGLFVCVLARFVRSGQFQCKHLLAVRLAPALGVSRIEEVDDDKLAQRISACDYG